MFCLDKTPTKGKFDARSKEGIFIGYSEESKGFRIWLPESRKVEITRDVKFLEKPLKIAEVSSEDFYPKKDLLSDPVDRAMIESIDIELVPRLPDAKQEDHEEVEEPGEADGQGERIVPRRKRGRPRIIRTGQPGRSRKEYDYHEDDEQAEFAYLAEIPVTSAIEGAHSSEWRNAMAAEVRSLIEKDTWKLVKR